jgi:hypothetical protein
MSEMLESELQKKSQIGNRHRRDKQGAEKGA